MSLQSAAIDPMMLRETFSCFPSGVVALCGSSGDQPSGMAVSSFSTVSLEPALVSVCVQKTSSTWPQLRGLSRIGVSVLAEGQEGVCRSLAGRGDRFQGVDWSETPNGAVHVDGSAAWFDCTIYEEIEAGDHWVVLLKIEAMTADRSRRPLVFHHSRFQRLASPGLPQLVVSEDSLAFLPPVCA